MSRPTYCRTTGRLVEQCDCMRCEPPRSTNGNGPLTAGSSDEEDILLVRAAGIRLGLVSAPAELTGTLQQETIA